MKAKFSQHRNDMHWEYWTGQRFVRWSGYDDSYWWANIAVEDDAKTKMVDGKTYVIDFNTCEVTVS